MIDFSLGVLAGVALTVSVPKVYVWGKAQVTKVKGWFAKKI